MLLFFDTETTGVKAKPWLVQLAAILTENDGTLRGSCNLIIKPDGWTVPDEAANIHGITTEIANRSGVPLSIAIALFNNLAIQCKEGRVIAHNKKFDLQIIDYCYERGGWPSRLQGMESFCTMEAMKSHCKIPPTPAMVRAGFKEFKSPKLSEAYQFAFEKPLENAHDALYDVNACRDLYFWLHPNKPIEKTEPDLFVKPQTPAEVYSNLRVQNAGYPGDREKLTPKLDQDSSQ